MTTSDVLDQMSDSSNFWETMKELVEGQLNKDTLWEDLQTVVGTIKNRSASPATREERAEFIGEVHSEQEAS